MLSIKQLQRQLITSLAIPLRLNLAIITKDHLPNKLDEQEYRCKIVF
ncbi:MAG: hypothetical protein F6K39_21635 [Okeania sp. SIO3B3]|nr:hypothetical protein [Okeania sp. SIO3B3]